MSNYYSIPSLSNNWVMNGKSYVHICIAMFLFSANLNAQAVYTISGTVVDQSDNPLAGCSVLAKEASGKESGSSGCATSTSGDFTITTRMAGRYLLSFSLIGFETVNKEVEVNGDISLAEIVLIESTKPIEASIVTGDMVEHFENRREYHLSRIDRSKYASALGALDHIPAVIVNDQNVSSADGGSVKILLNGIPAKPTDLATISPDHIDKIVFYSQPPIQYAALGIGSVINVVLKKNITGCSLGINSLNAVTTAFGNDLVGINYNRNDSRIGITYNVRYRDYQTRALDDLLNYCIEDDEYTKEKNGENGKYTIGDNSFEVSYNAAKDNDYLFGAKAAISAFDSYKESLQSVTSFVNNLKTGSLSANSVDANEYVRPALDLYFNKTFNSKQDLLFNLVGTYYKSQYDYSYSEKILEAESPDLKPVDAATNIDVDKYSLIIESQYSAQLRKARIFAGVRNSYSNSTQNNLSASNKIIADNIFLYPGISLKIKSKFSFDARMEFRYDYYSALDKKAVGYWRMQPSIRAAFLINKQSALNFQYNMARNAPPVNYLTNNPYYCDNRFLKTGNPALTPSRGNEIRLSYNRGSKSFVVQFAASYSNIKGEIAPVFINGETEIVETYQNLDRSEKTSLNLYLQWYPFRNDLLRLRLFQAFSYTENSLGGIQWERPIYNIAADVYLKYKKWSAEAFYQNPGKILNGQYLITDSSLTRCELKYHPTGDLEFGIAVRYPFYDAWTYKQKTIGTPVRKDSVEKVYEQSNMLYFTLVYNFSVGNKGIKATRGISNEDSDSGILSR